MAITRPRPDYVHQSNREHCWAACFDSMSRIEPRMGGHVNQADLVRAPWIHAYLDAGGGLHVSDGLPVLGNHFHMLRTATGPATPPLTPAMFESVLNNTYIIVVYIVNPGEASHFVLAYGVTDTVLQVMDPYRGFIDVPFTVVVGATALRLLYMPPPQ